MRKDGRYKLTEINQGHAQLSINHYYTNIATCFDIHKEALANKFSDGKRGPFPVPATPWLEIGWAIHGSGPFFPVDNLVGISNQN